MSIPNGNSNNKIQDEVQALAEKIKLHEENIKILRTEEDELEDSILEKQVSLANYYSSTPSSTRNDRASYIGGEEQILNHVESAAAVLCQLKRLPSAISPLATSKDILGVVATLGRVQDVNLSRLLSEYVGVETMLAIVCKTGAGVKALEDYSKDGTIDKNAGIHGCSAYIGSALAGRFLAFCLENLRPYVGGFVPEDPQRRLQILKPRLPSGECPPGFLDFAVNMIDVDATHQLCLTSSGFGLRETLFYHLFSRTQVYRSRAEMLSARPLISEGAISLDGGIIRSSGANVLGNRQDADVHFPSPSGARETPANYQELQEKVMDLKSTREMVLEDLQKERQLLDNVKLNFGQKKQESVKFVACSSAYAAQEMRLGPRKTDVLNAQGEHRSSIVWEAGYSVNNVLKCCRVEKLLKGLEYDQRMDVYLRQSGFYGVAKLPFISLDWALITALTERWRPETHTFHMVHGEMTVTLQDVAILLGLPIDGDAVIGDTSLSNADVCQQLLGRVPTGSNIRSGRIKLSWLAQNFAQIPINATDEVIQMYTRAYILMLIGGRLFCTKSDNLVHLFWLPLLANFERTGHYSWGSACLAWLYRNLCRASHRKASQIAGPLILLQIWAWDRFPHIAPLRRCSPFVEDMPLSYRWGVSKDVRTVTTHVLSSYRESFDRQSIDQVNWHPYPKELVAMLPAYCRTGDGFWHARVPLICFHIVEWHFPDRVIRQFGDRQLIPDQCDTSKALHRIDLRGKNMNNWREIHQQFVELWDDRMNKVVPLVWESHMKYSKWYARHTLQFISHTGSMLGTMVNNFQKIKLKSDQPELASLAEESIQMMREFVPVRLYGRAGGFDDQPALEIIGPHDGEQFEGDEEEAHE